MKLILDKFKQYYPRYDVKNKVLYLHGKVYVKHLVALKELLKSINEEVKDIRINW